MALLKGIYKCEMCGNIVEVLVSGSADLVCCEENMILQKENTLDASKEKHVPVIEKTSEGFKVKVGSSEHPMEEKHYIMFIELISENKVYRKHLKPGDKPDANFCINTSNVVVREYCNLHGLWKSSL
ncbi:MAG: desulfoferrodoxin [Oligoflexia bacterium]|nr:desulfoferrodoxin [Oligoflexia bacterium]